PVHREHELITVRNQEPTFAVPYVRVQRRMADLDTRVTRLKDPRTLRRTHRRLRLTPGPEQIAAAVHQRPNPLAPVARRVLIQLWKMSRDDRSNGLGGRADLRRFAFDSHAPRGVVHREH